MLDNNCVKPIDPRYRAISILLANNPRLLDYLFQKNRHQLQQPPEEIMEDIGYLSSGEQVLMRIALDLWSGDGAARLGDIVWTLDDVRFDAFLMALESLRFTKLAKLP